MIRIKTINRYINKQNKVSLRS